MFNLISFFAKLLQHGLSDLERQAIQQKIEAEIQMQKEDHLTVYRKQNSLEGAANDLISDVTSIEQSITMRPKARDFKSIVSTFSMTDLSFEFSYSLTLTKSNYTSPYLN